MVTGTLWAADIESFNDLERINYCIVEDGQLIVGLTTIESYTKPPGTICGIFTDLPKPQSGKAFEKNRENIKTVLAYWHKKGILKES